MAKKRLIEFTSGTIPDDPDEDVYLTIKPYGEGSVELLMTRREALVIIKLLTSALLDLEED